MGNSNSSKTNELGLGRHSTAKEVVEKCGKGDYLKGTTAIVTGGNSGIGLETCKALMSAGARVILCSRSVDAAQKAVDSEISKPGLGGYTVAVTKENLSIKALDLNSMKSIKCFADEILKEEKHIELLILNAGIMATPTRELTADGFEKQIGVNVFGHHYLTKLLLPTLLKQAPKPCRVVCLSSTAHDMGSVDVSDLHFNKGRIYKPWVAYGQSKQGDLLYAKALAKQTRGTNVTAVSVHPGVIATNLWRTTNPLMKSFVQMFVMDKTVPQGAACSVYAALAPCLQQDSMRGVYLSDCHPKTPTCESARDEDGTVSESFYKVMDEQVNSVVSSWTK